MCTNGSSDMSNTISTIMSNDSSDNVSCKESEVNLKKDLESLVDYDKEIYNLFKSYDKLEELQMNIFEFFNKYPTKKTVRCPDGTIINMNANEPAVDIYCDKLPLLDGIPQGEEATRLILKNMDTGIIISSPPGVQNTYFITRYGSPLSYTKQIRYDDYEIKRYDELRKYFSINVLKDSNVCFLNKFKCDSVLKKYIVYDFDTEVYSCQNHCSIISSLININIALIHDINLFITNDIIKKYMFFNNTKKLNLLKMVKETLKQAEMGKLINKQLDSDFVLYGIHYYSQFIDYKHVYGWALVYHNSNNRIAHIYLDQITNNIEVIKTIQLFAYEIIFAKHYNDIPHIDTFLKYQKKPQYNQLEKMCKKSYIINVRHIIDHNMIY